MYGHQRYDRKKNNAAMLRCTNCNFCGLKAQLLDHVVRSHVSTDRVPWICSLCGYRAVARNLLVIHERLPIHKNALKRKPDAAFQYIKSNNPYHVRQGVDYMFVDDNDWGDDDGDELRCMKRKGLDTNQNRKKIRADNQFESRHHDDIYRDGPRFDFDVRERPDRPNYDIEEDDFHRYDFYQTNSNSEYQCTSYNEWYKRQSFQQSLRNQVRFMSNTQNFSNNHLDYRSGHRNAEGPFSDNVMSSSDMELEPADAFGLNRGSLDRVFESSGGGFGSSRLQPRFQSRMAANARRGGRMKGVTKIQTISNSPVISENTQNQPDMHSSFDKRDNAAARTSQSPPHPSAPRCPPEDASPPRAKADTERAPASSSTPDRVQNEAVLKNHSVHETKTPKEDSRVVLCNKNVAQSAEIGSTCGTSKEKGVEEMTSQPEIQSGTCKQTTERRRFSSGLSGVGEQEQNAQQTVLEDHEEEAEHDGDEMTDSQILEDKMTDLISALEPLKNISKALIALDHHMRRLLPMVEHLVKDSQHSSDKKNKVNS